MTTYYLLIQAEEGYGHQDYALYESKPKAYEEAATFAARRLGEKKGRSDVVSEMDEFIEAGDFEAAYETFRALELEDLNVELREVELIR